MLEKGERAVILLSGGIDSTTALKLLLDEGAIVTALIFDYGQSLRREIQVASENAQVNGVGALVISADLNWVDPSCALLSAGNIPKGRTREEIDRLGTPPTYVPFRNGIFLSFAVAYGEAHDIPWIICGGNGLNSGQYPDDTAEFANQFEHAAETGTSPKYHPQIWFPWCEIPKSEIVKHGLEYGLDYSATWSCYENGPVHCGTCDSCVQRRAALEPNGLNINGQML